VCTEDFPAFWSRFRDAVARNDAQAVRDLTVLPFLFEGEPHHASRFGRVYDALFDAKARSCIARTTPREEDDRYMAFCGPTIFVFARRDERWRFSEFAADPEAAEDDAESAGAAGDGAAANPSDARAAIPTSAPGCALKQPPDSAGAYVTPGGFVLIHPRNAELSDAYTGCKHAWVVDTDRINRLMTLYFKKGHLRGVVAYDGRGETSEPRATCVLPRDAASCEGVDDNPLTALRVPTYPRRCMEKPDDPACAGEPE
jgi:hypothetical protein